MAYFSSHSQGGVGNERKIIIIPTEQEGYHLAKWQTFDGPKGEGGWGLKHIHLFGTALAAKSLWNFRTKDGLWKRNIVQKYNAPGPTNYTRLDWKWQEIYQECS